MYVHSVPKKLQLYVRYARKNNLISFSSIEVHLPMSCTSLFVYGTCNCTGTGTGTILYIEVNGINKKSIRTYLQQFVIIKDDIFIIFITRISYIRT